MTLNTIDNQLSALKNFDFEAIWKGSANNTISNDYKNVLQELEKCNKDISKYNEILELKRQYEEIKTEISILTNECLSCECRRRQVDGTCSACMYRYEKINDLSFKKEEIYKKIAQALLHFNIVAPNYETIIQDEIDDIIFPLYDQNKYADIPYYKSKDGQKTIATSGCGITCAAMVISAYTSKKITPDMLVNEIPYTGNNTTMQAALNKYDIKNANNNRMKEGFEEADKNFYNYYEIKEKIEEGYIAIFQMKKGYFTNEEHFILITGINEEGKFIVNDPNGKNYTKKNKTLEEGFQNGFSDAAFINSWSGCYLIEPYETYKVRNNSDNSSE